MLGAWPPRLEICVIPATALADAAGCSRRWSVPIPVRFIPFEEGVNPAALSAFGVDPPPSPGRPALFALPNRAIPTACAVRSSSCRIRSSRAPSAVAQLVEQETGIAPARRGAGGHGSRADRP